ncbi:MAG: hypothetical protein HYX92_02275 [Chloroflexi bacterium]|nr:hypothetical protein [Chloroflexota bacterium]
MTKAEKGKVYQSVLLRQSYREGGRVKNRTLASLTALPAAAIDAVERILRGQRLAPVEEALTVERSRPHGHVAAVLGMVQKLGLEELLDTQASRQRDLVVAMVAGRVLQPASKLDPTRLLNTTSLGETLGVEGATEDELYAALASIGEEAALDGLYVLRTNVPQEGLDTAGVALACKSLAHVGQAFRDFKLSDLEVRPIYHYREGRVRAHLLLCMLVYFVQRQMQRALAPLLFVDEMPPERPDPVSPAPRSEGAKGKAQRKTTADGLPVQSFRTLLAHLATLVKNRIVPRGADPAAAFELLTQPSPLQQRAFDLPGLRPSM